MDVCEHGRPDHQELIRELLEALGLPTHARPESPQQVFEECLAECRRLRSLAATSLDGLPTWDVATFTPSWGD